MEIIETLIPHLNNKNMICTAWNELLPMKLYKVM